MKSLTNYRLKIEDESHLTSHVLFHFNILTLTLTGFGIFLCMLLLSGLIVMMTPLHRLLPGYMKESERAASEENLMRLDSLRQAYSINQAFIDNYLKVMDTNREAQPDSVQSTVNKSPYRNQDSLLSPLPRESKFMSEMEKKERYNISVLAPLAADAIMFSPISADGIFTSESRTSEKGVILTPEGSSVLSVADGTVLACFYSPSEGGYSIVIQHNRGFVTAYSHIGEPLVDTGDAVITGQAISIDNPADKRGRHWFGIRMWHNCLPIIPFEYLDAGTADIREAHQ